VIELALAMKLTLGTATPGGGFPVYGDAVIAAIRDVDRTLEIEPRNTKGSTENVPLLEKNELDLALVQGEVAYEALQGVGRPPSAIRIVAAMYSTPGMFVVRADSPARRIEDLRGKPVAFGARGSGLVLLARYVLDGLGLDPERDFQAVYLDRAGDGPVMVQDGRVAALWGGGVGWPGFTAVAKAPAGARFIVPDADGLRKIQDKHTFLKPLTVPAGSYPGQDAPIQSLGSGRSSWPARASATMRRIASRRHCISRRPASRSGCRRAKRRPQATPRPPRRGPI
jgi:TRAP transporter TAXI family solute receptor